MEKINHNEKGSRGYLVGIVMVAVLGGLLFGYDTAVISGAEKGLQAFFKGAKDFEYTDFMHGITSSSALIGCIFGSFLSGYFASHFGRKKSLIFAGVCFFLSAWGSMSPETFGLLPYGKPTWTLLVVFNLYRVLGGIGVGMASALCPMYIGEVAPSNIRGMLVSFNQFAIIFGQLVVYFVNFIILGNHANPIYDAAGAIANWADCEWTVETGWRYMFGSEMVPAGLFTILICFVPETPRYLTMIGQDEKALSILTRINGYSVGVETLNNIKNTVAEKTEKLLSYGFMCVFVGIMLSVFQQIVGINAVLYYAPRIFQDMGMGNPMVQTVIMGVINISFTLVAVFTVDKIGRKPLLIWGSIGMAVGAFVVAITFGNASLNMVTMVALMVYSASFMFSWGPICWVYMAELFPNTIRGKATAIAVAFQWICNFLVSSTFVPMFNMHLQPGDNFGHWFTYGLYGVICVIAAVFVWKLVPETKGKTLEDMSALWRSRMKK